MRILLLGGTAEARDLAALLDGRPGLTAVTSLAGRTAAPRPPAGAVRTGGFGDVDGLVEHLRAERVDRVVDATHPFATAITGHAVAACTRAGVPLLLLRRPPWQEAEGDRWLRVPTVAAAARAVAAGPAGTALLTLGRRAVGAFAGDAARHYVVRCVDPPSAPLPPRHTLLLDRGPFDPDGERALLRRHGVTVLVSRDSGGAATAPKLVAARERGVPVVLVDRPPQPRGAVTVTTPQEVLTWLGGGASVPRPGDTGR